MSIPRDGTSDKVTIKGSSSCVDSAKGKLLEIVNEIVSYRYSKPVFQGFNDYL